MKTMAIRLDEAMSAQLTMLAQLEGVSVTDLIRQAIEQLIADKRSAGDLAARAEAVLADIDREASARKEAIEALFGSGQPAPESTPPARPPRKGRASQPDQ